MDPRDFWGHDDISYRVSIFRNTKGVIGNVGEGTMFPLTNMTF